MNEASDQARAVARKIIKRLSEDIFDRAGLGDEWVQISPNVMDEEIVPTWTNIIIEEISRKQDAAPNNNP